MVILSRSQLPAGVCENTVLFLHFHHVAVTLSLWNKSLSPFENIMSVLFLHVQMISFHKLLETSERGCLAAHGTGLGAGWGVSECR